MKTVAVNGECVHVKLEVGAQSGSYAVRHEASRSLLVAGSNTHASIRMDMILLYAHRNAY